MARSPSWRPRVIHGYKVEALKTTRNLDLECDLQWQNANLHEGTRELLIQRELTAWFVRLPGEKKTFATLVEFNGYRTPGNQAWRVATFDADVPLTNGDEPVMMSSSNYHISCCAGRAVLYMNGNPEWLWIDLKDHLDAQAVIRRGAQLADHPEQDWDAFRDV